MKKAISVLLVLFLLLSMTNALAEVSFNGVEFLSSDDAVLGSLREKGFAKAGTISAFSNENITYLVANEALGYQPTYVQSYRAFCFSQTIPGLGKIAGYPVKDLILTYAYDGSYKLIAIRVELIGADYAALLEKLIKAYGTADVKAVEDEGITSNIWKDGDTAVVLYTESEGYDYTLIYGRTDAEEILANCMTSDPDDVFGL